MSKLIDATLKYINSDKSNNSLNESVRVVNEGSSKHLVKKIEGNGVLAKVYRDTEWQEYIVRFFDKNGKEFVDADYHTDDLDDAIGTAQAQMNQLGGSIDEATHESDPKILRPGQKGTTSGYPATVLRHYDGSMYEVRVPGGVVCISASDFIPESEPKNVDESRNSPKFKQALELAKEEKEAGNIIDYHVDTVAGTVSVETDQGWNTWYDPKKDESDDIYLGNDDRLSEAQETITYSAFDKSSPVQEMVQLSATNEADAVAEAKLLGKERGWKVVGVKQAKWSMDDDLDEGMSKQSSSVGTILLQATGMVALDTIATDTSKTYVIGNTATDAFSAAYKIKEKLRELGFKKDVGSDWLNAIKDNIRVSVSQVGNSAVLKVSVDANKTDLDEGIGDFVSGVAGGVKKAVQGIGQNYRTGRDQAIVDKNQAEIDELQAKIDALKNRKEPSIQNASPAPQNAPVANDQAKTEPTLQPAPATAAAALQQVRSRKTPVPKQTSDSQKQAIDNLVKAFTAKSIDPVVAKSIVTMGTKLMAQGVTPS